MVQRFRQRLGHQVVTLDPAVDFGTCAPAD